jgi:mRNA interferase MazF
VLSPRAYNRKVGLALFCPVTSEVKGYPFEVVLPPGLKVKGAILSDQVKSLDWRVRGDKWVCTVPPEILEETVARILVLVDPEEGR